MPKAKRGVTGLDRLAMAVTKKSLEDIRHLTDKDEEMVHAVLNNLGLSPAAHRPYGKILAMRYGLFGGQPHTLIRLNQVFGISATSLNTYMLSAIKNIRHNPDWYGVFTGMLIETEHAPEEEWGDVPNRSIECLNFSVQLTNRLREGGIETVKDLTEKSEQDLLSMRWIGRKYVNDIIAALDGLGLKLVKGNFSWR